MPERREVKIDAFMPPEMASKAEDAGVKKGHLPLMEMFMLAVMAGSFIAMGAVLSTTVVTGNGAGGAIKLPYGLMKLLGGFSFCLGLILVIIAGAELFTGNCLMVMATVSRKMTVTRLFRNWIVVYCGNLVGSVVTAYVMFYTGQFESAGGLVGDVAMTIANGKCGLTLMEALTRGVYCNALVCLAVWLCFSCRTTGDKILAILFPITAFVAVGFEHCVANMYFVPIGIFIKGGASPEFWSGIGKTASSFANLTWGNFIIKNLIPVTIGNIIGGAGFVAVVYWVVYRWAAQKEARRDS
ncbi:formate transporter FocA [Candidatus Hydrogenedentota bacterium]